MTDIKLINLSNGCVAAAEIDGVRERMKGEWIHYSEEGDVCLKCWKVGPFVWVDSEYKYEDNPNRCELRSNENATGF